MMSTRTVLGGLALPGLLLAAASLFPIASAHADDWLPTTAEELQLKDEPGAPKASAIYLYRQIDRNDVAHWERVYVRIKVLTDEGRSAGNVVIRFDQGAEAIRDIEARTIRPDGSVVKFDGTVYEKPLMEARGVHVMTKTFSLPEVQPGCIVEYRYERRTPYGFVFNSHWTVSADLYTRLAKFSLVPFRGYALRTTSPAGLPPATVGPTFAHGAYTMVTRDVAPFVAEEYMPPADELKMRVEFVYLKDSTIDKDAAAFWLRWAKLSNEFLKRYMEDDGAMRAAVAQILSPNDSPEQKLRKLYARAQRIRNLSYGLKRSTEEVERESGKDNRDVTDVLKHGYGDEHQITWLFVALARAAGFQADPVALATRNRFLFNEAMRNPSQLNAGIAVVRLDDRQIFLAPGCTLAPFGTLPWNQTGVKGLRINESGGVWVSTPVPPASASGLERKASLRLTPDAGLEGTVTFTYTGLDALARRLDERNEDDTERRRVLEEEVKADMVGGSEVTLTRAPNWTDSEVPLVAVFEVKIPGWAHTAGARVLIPVGIFAEADRHVFEHATRTHAVYFHYLHRLQDDVSIDLPAGWKVSSVPAPGGADMRAVDFKWTAQSTSTALHLQRDFSIDTLLIDPAYYGQLRDFYQAVRHSGDEEAVVSLPSGAGVHAASS